MLSKLMSIAFAINIVMCSIGVQVMQHHCVWCGGDRIEFLKHQAVDECENSCCFKKESAHHDCKDEGCCQPKLLKLTSGMTSEDGIDLKNTDYQTVTFHAPCLSFFLQSNNYPSVARNFSDNRGSPIFFPPPAFLTPMRC